MENGAKKIGLRMVAGVFVSIIIIVAVFASGITLPSQEIKTGNLIVLLKDAPVDLNKLLITITDLEVHKVGTGEGEEAVEGGWTYLIKDDGITFNLLDYQDENTLSLASVEIEAGKYNKIRMYVYEAWVDFKDPDRQDDYVNVPPGKIDVVTNFELQTDETEIVTIDMEPDWVAISTSNNLRPTLTATISEVD
jgi:hypothetical protein